MAKGAQAFWDYYQKWFDGSNLRSRLECKNVPVLRFAVRHETELKKLWSAAGLSWQVLGWYPHALSWPKEVSLGETLPGFVEGFIYPMNQSSLLPVLAMEVKSDDNVLDACAAPGGKALMIHDLLGKNGHLVANDLSGARVSRMKSVFRDYRAESIEVSTLPAETIYKDAYETFDKILLDAPCSSEKHVIESQEGLQRWSVKRVKQLRQRQYVLTLQLLKALKPGGRLVYSTCAVTPEENEAVIARMLKNRGDEVELVDFDWQNWPGGSGMEGEYVADFDLGRVRRVVPDCEGLDPMFVAVLEKTKV